MPNGSNRSLWGNTLGLISSGLPNITAQAGIANSATRAGQTTNYIGAFSLKTDSSGWAGATGQNDNYNRSVYFDASLSNSIYGTTTYVRPQSIGVKFVIKY